MYRKEGKSDRYLLLKNEFDMKIKSEAEKYHKKVLDEVLEGKRYHSYKALTRLESNT